LLSRIGDYRSGTQPKGDTTAYEASLVESGSSLGITALQDALGDFSKDDAEIAVALMRENYDADRVVWDDVNKALVHYNKENLIGYTEVDVDILAAAPPDNMRKKMESRELLELFKDDQMIDQTKLKTNVLEPYEIVDDPAKWLNSSEDMQGAQNALNAGNEGQGIPNV